VGVVITDSLNRIVATGYNGAPMGLPQCDQVGHLMIDGHCVRTIHGEMNSCLQLQSKLDHRESYVMHCVYRPCIPCLNFIIQWSILNPPGIAIIAWEEAYRDSEECAAQFKDILMNSPIVGVDMSNAAK
jgi:dCMP deaminase